METNMSKIKTINLKGKDYAPVAERLKTLHEEEKGIDIDTTVEFKEGFAYVKAVISIADRGTYSGHSFGELKKQKALEKLECVPLDTEILTRDGFKFYHEVSEGDEVLTYNHEQEKSEWQNIQKVSTFKNAPLVEMKTSRFRAVCTPDHKWVYEKGNKVKLSPLNEIPIEKGDVRLILSGAENYDGENGSETAEKLGWLFTDGYVRYTPNGLPTNSLIKQSKLKQVKRLKELFGEPTSTKTYVDEGWMDSYEWYVSAKDIRKVLGEFNVRDYNDLPKAVSRMAINEVSSFYRAVMMADGYEGGFSKTYKPVVEAVQICAARLGIKTSRIKKEFKIGSTKPLYTIRIHKGNGAYTSEFKISDVPPRDVWCPTIPNGTWFARQNEQVWITGNTVAVGRALAFAGYLAGGEIASYDEMEKFQDDNDGKNGDGLNEKISRVNSEAIVKDIGDCVKLKELEKLWGGLNTYQKQHPDVNDAKDIKKEELSK